MLILEDDIKQPKQEEETAILEKVVTELKGNHLSFDLCYISYSGEKRVCEKKEDIKRERGQFKYIWKMYGTYSTSGYIVSRRGAQKILDRLCIPPMTLAIDNYYRTWTLEGYLIAYGSILRLFNQDKSMKSSIGNDQDPYIQFEKIKYIVNYKDLMESLT